MYEYTVYQPGGNEWNVVGTIIMELLSTGRKKKRVSPFARTWSTTLVDGGNAMAAIGINEFFSSNITIAIKLFLAVQLKVTG